MHAYDRLYIGGEWVAMTGIDAVEVTSPHSERVMGRAPRASGDDAARAVAAARAAFDDGEWPHLVPVERARYLIALSGAYEPHIDEMAALITEEMGSPISYSRFGQAGTIWTNDTERGMDIARSIRTGSVGINQYLPDFAAPLGGFKDSGIGREGGTEGIDQYVELQSLLPGARV